MDDKKDLWDSGNVDRGLVVQKIKVDGLSYLQRRVRCCNERCLSCPHGPYWYVITRRHGKTREVYIGKDFMTLSEKNYRKKVEKEEKDREKRTQGGLSRGD